MAAFIKLTITDTFPQTPQEAINKAISDDMTEKKKTLETYFEKLREKSPIKVDNKKKSLLNTSYFDPTNSEALYYPQALKRATSKPKSTDKYEEITKEIADNVTSIVEKLLREQEAKLMQIHEKAIEELSFPKRLSRSPSPTAFLRKADTTIAPDEQAKSVQDENKKLKDKLKSLQDTLDEMRSNYFKEIQNLKEIQFRHLHDRGYEDYINVQFFEPSVGINEELAEMLNIKIRDLKIQYEGHLNKIAKDNERLNETIEKYQRMKPKSFSMMDLEFKEIFEAIAIIEREPSTIWKAINDAKIVEQEYGKFLMNNNTGSLTTEIEKLKEAAQRQMQEISEASLKEINELKKLNNEKQNEIHQLKEKQLQDFERAKEFAYQVAELKFKEIEAQIFKKYDEEKAELFKQLREAELKNEEFYEIMSQEKLKRALLRWSMLTKIRKATQGATEAILQAIKQDSESAFDQLREQSQGNDELRETISSIKEENARLAMLNVEFLCDTHNNKQKSLYLEDKIQDFQQENEHLQENLNVIRDQHRKFLADYEASIKVNETSKELIKILEYEKEAIAEQLAKFLPGKAGDLFKKTSPDLLKVKMIREIAEDGKKAINSMFPAGLQTKGTMTKLRGLEQDIRVNNGLDKVPTMSREVQSDEIEKTDQQEQTDPISFAEAAPPIEHGRIITFMDTFSELGPIDPTPLMEEKNFSTILNEDDNKLLELQTEDNRREITNEELDQENFNEVSESKELSYLQNDALINREYAEQIEELVKSQSNIFSPNGSVIGDAKIETLSQSKNYKSHSDIDVHDEEMQDHITREGEAAGEYTNVNASVGSAVDETAEHVYKDEDFMDMDNFDKALKYMANKVKPKLRRPMTDSQKERLYPINLPEVYSRLYKDASSKGERSKELKVFFEALREREWKNTMAAKDILQKHHESPTVKKDSLTGKTMMSIIDFTSASSPKSNNITISGNPKEHKKSMSANFSNIKLKPINETTSLMEQRNGETPQKYAERGTNLRGIFDQSESIIFNELSHKRSLKKDLHKSDMMIKSIGADSPGTRTPELVSPSAFSPGNFPKRMNSVASRKYKFHASYLTHKRTNTTIPSQHSRTTKNKMQSLGSEQNLNDVINQNIFRMNSAQVPSKAFAAVYNHYEKSNDYHTRNESFADYLPEVTTQKNETKTEEQISTAEGPELTITKQQSFLIPRPPTVIVDSKMSQKKARGMMHLIRKEF